MLGGRQTGAGLMTLEKALNCDTSRYHSIIIDEA